MALAARRWHDRIPKSCTGQGLAEYALIIALVAIVCASGVGIFGAFVNGIFSAGVPGL
jgi:hypothetical protein